MQSFPRVIDYSMTCWKMSLNGVKIGTITTMLVLRRMEVPGSSPRERSEYVGEVAGRQSLGRVGRQCERNKLLLSQMKVGESA